MKKTILSIAFLLAGAAQAQTVVTLEPKYCGALPVCQSVVNDAALDISVAFEYMASNGVHFTINGEVWDSGPQAGNGLDFTQGVYIYGPDGAVGTFTGLFTHTARRGGGSGRGGYRYRQILSLVSGTLSLP